MFFSSICSHFGSREPSTTFVVAAVFGKARKMVVGMAAMVAKVDRDCSVW